MDGRAHHVGDGVWGVSPPELRRADDGAARHDRGAQSHNGDLCGRWGSDPTADETRSKVAQGLHPLSKREGRKRSLQPRLKAPASAEEQRLDRGRRHRKRGGDLLIRETAHLAQENRLTLLDRELGKRIT